MNSGCGDVGQIGTFTDERDGQTYRTVKMPDGKVWMAQNLNYKPKRGNSWCYNDDESMGEKYGRLYDWETAVAVAPMRWHLPTNQEWADLISVLGSKAVAGMKLKSNSGWNDSEDGESGNGRDDYGFSALPGGYRRHDSGSFGAAGVHCGWWTATEGSSDEFAYRRYMINSGGSVNESNYFRGGGLSVRCVQDGSGKR